LPAPLYFHEFLTKYLLKLSVKLGTFCKNPLSNRVLLAINEAGPYISNGKQRHIW